MRVSLLPALAAVAALALFAPTAGARPIDTSALTPATQNLSSPDAQDANAAGNAQTLDDLARLHAGNPHTAGLAQEKYYSSYGRATTRHTAPTTADDGFPWLTIVLGFGLTALVAGSVAFAVRTRRRTARVRVAA